MTEYTFSTLDLPTLHRHAVGFDRMFDELNRTFANARTGDHYPPYNIANLDDTHFVVEVAVAGDDAGGHQLRAAADGPEGIDVMEHLSALLAYKAAAVVGWLALLIFLFYRFTEYFA